MKKYYNTLSALFICCILTSSPVVIAQNNSGYVKGDFHQHTTYTDGAYSIKQMNYMDNKYGLDWWANSEHGGAFSTDGSGEAVTTPPFLRNTGKFWDSYLPNPILGSINKSKTHQRMWRWQSLMDYSFKDIIEARKIYPNKVIVQGFEWNVPGHEHCSTGLIANQYNVKPNCNPLAEFEYKFDDLDTDRVGGANLGWIKSAKKGHAKALEAAEWMQKKYQYQSWLLFNHPERKHDYKIEDFRDFNNIAPDVCFGFEAMPGHQKGKDRGEYAKHRNSDGSCTFGGVGIYAAKIGGMWDAMLEEGRHFWIFTGSDCHDVGTDVDMKKGDDFWPAEYQKNYTYTKNKNSAQTILNGMRSGNTWIVSGDLIDSLNFSVDGSVMGSNAKSLSKTAQIKIIIRNPKKNNNTYSVYTQPVLDHVDIIAGEIKAKAKPGSKEYSVNTNPTAKIIARFDSNGNNKDDNGIVSRKWVDKKNGLIEIKFNYKINANTYFRLRGTNHKINALNETDGAGNPLPDTLIANNASVAFADLWFYSNPVFVYTNNVNATNSKAEKDINEAKNTVGKSDGKNRKLK